VTHPLLPVICAILVALCWLAAPVTTLIAGRGANSPFWSIAVGAGAVALLCAGIAGLAGTTGLWNLPYPLWLGAARFTFRLDALAAYFLVVIAVVTVPIAFYLPAYMEHLCRKVDMRLFWISLSTLLLSMSGVVLAANVLTFLVAWELMSLSSFLLVAADHQPHANRQAALIYLGATRLGTAFLAGGFLWALALSGSWTFQDWHFRGAAALGPGILLIIGLGVKAGMWPFDLWLPIAHPAAPSPVSALMSGVMVKVAIYMMVRLFLLQPAFNHPALGYILLGLGAISAFWGVLFALLQHDFKRLLAYHTVENVGLILIGVGGSIAAANLGLPVVATLALGAALFHVLNHALFKSLLFLGAGAVDFSSHTRDLDQLGGLGQRMPWTFALFTLGAAAICGLPPLNGFASEWMLYQGSLHLSGSRVIPLLRFSGLLMAGWIALVGALALACFTKAVGVVFQGRPRSRGAEHAKEVPGGMLVAQGLLAAGCILLGLGAPYVLRLLQSFAIIPGAGPHVLSSAWTLPIGTLAVVLALTFAAGGLWLSEASKRDRVRSYITWECGFGDLTPRMQITATSFVQPIARMFGMLFRYAVHFRIEGTNRRLFPETIVVEPRTEALLETQVYAPVVWWVDRAGSWIARMQAGSIHLYLLTMFVTLLILLLIAGRHP